MRLPGAVPRRVCADLLLPCLPVHAFSVGRPTGAGGCAPRPHGTSTLLWRAARGRFLRLTLRGRSPGSRLRGQLRQVVCLLHPEDRGSPPPGQACALGAQGGRRLRRWAGEGVVGALCAVCSRGLRLPCRTLVLCSPCCAPGLSNHALCLPSRHLAFS